MLRSSVFLQLSLLLTFAFAEPAAKQCVCEVVATSALRETRNGTWTGSHQFECIAAPSENVFCKVDLHIEEYEPIYKRNEEAFRAGMWFLKFPCSWIVGKALPRERTSQVLSLSKEEVQAIYHPTRHLRTAKHRTLSNIGKQNCGIVIVSAPDALNPLSVEDAEYLLYGKANRQFHDCSNGALELVKKDDTVKITLPRKIGTFSSNNVDDMLFQLICEYYNYDSNCEISKERGLDHILFSLPYGISDDDDTLWAYASAGDSRRFSVYGGGTSANYVDGEIFDSGSFVPSTIMHE